jgi:hypothetical protein
MRTREELSALIEGRLSSAAGRSALVELATRLIVEEALEGEARDTLGRGYYEHGVEPGQGYRNGTRPGRLKTAEGSMSYSAPQIAGLDQPYRSEIREHLKGQTEALESLAVEMLARGLSGTGHRGRVSGRERPSLAVQDGGGRDRQAIVGRLSGVQEPGSWRVRDRLSVHRRHC